MAQVSRAYVQRQAGLIANLSKAAKKTVTKRLEGISDLDTTASIMSETCKAYTDMSAAITVQFYGGIRKASKTKSRYTPAALSGYNADRVYSATISILEEVESGSATVSAVELLSNVVNREVKNAADYCVRENVKRDPARPKYAIVPNGDACAFCQMRASLGYTYGDDDASHSHDHCTCTATPVFGGESIEGYNPKEYEGRYNEAKDALASGDISDELRERIEAQKAEKGRGFDKTNAILMVMREQQGIS